MPEAMTLERRLISQELRVLFSRMRAGTITEADFERLPELFTALADGDTDAAESALKQLIALLNQGDVLAESVVRLFGEGRADVTGIRDGQLAWTLTASEAAAQEDSQKL